MKKSRRKNKRRCLKRLMQRRKLSSDWLLIFVKGTSESNKCTSEVSECKSGVSGASKQYLYERERERESDEQEYSYLSFNRIPSR